MSGFGAIRISKPRSNEDLRGVGIWRYKDIKTTQQRGAATRINEEQQRGAATRSSNEEQQRGSTRCWGFGAIRISKPRSNEDLRGVGIWRYKDIKTTQQRGSTRCWGFGAIRISKPRSNEDLRGVGDFKIERVIR